MKMKDFLTKYYYYYKICREEGRNVNTFAEGFELET